jgi:hypothetical protein
MGGYKPTTKPPEQINRLTNDVYKGGIPLREVHQHVLVRDVKLTALGVLNAPSIRIVSTLSLPHHTGAGGEDDFL